MTEIRPRKVGRPPKTDRAMRQIAVRLPVDMLDEIDAMCAERMDRPDRSVLVRELLAKGITADREAGA